MDQGRESTPPLSPLSRLTLATAAAALIAGALWHLALVFLYVAPPNSVSQRYQGTISGHIYPEFAQNWQLFAPNPTHDNVVVQARVRVTTASGGQAESPWIGLTARDISRIVHDPVPSHADQNMLRVAWDTLMRSDASKSKGPYDTLYREYVERIALQRLGRDWSGLRIDAIQLQSVSFPITFPSADGAAGRPAPVYSTLPWWPVTGADYEGLL